MQVYSKTKLIGKLGINLKAFVLLKDTPSDYLEMLGTMSIEVDLKKKQIENLVSIFFFTKKELEEKFFDIKNLLPMSMLRSPAKDFFKN